MLSRLLFRQEGKTQVVVGADAGEIGPGRAVGFLDGVRAQVGQIDGFEVVPDQGDFLPNWRVRSDR